MRVSNKTFAELLTMQEMVQNEITLREQTHLKRMRSSGRKYGVTGTTPSTVTSWVMSNVPKSKATLDFGAGASLCQYKLLRKAGYKNVHPVDMDAVMNNWPGKVKLWSLDKEFSVVMISNVLNVLLSNMIRPTLDAASSWAIPGTLLIANYPSTPRYAEFTLQGMRVQWREYFSKGWDVWYEGPLIFAKKL